MVGNTIKHYGFEVECFVKSEFEKQGFEVTKIDDYFDLKVIKNNKSKKIEVKSCNLIVKNGGSVECFGKFDFTNPKNRSLQRSNNVDICFVAVIKGQFEIIGFINAKSLKCTRYVLFKKLINRKLTRFNKYILRFDK